HPVLQLLARLLGQAARPLRELAERELQRAGPAAEQVGLVAVRFHREDLARSISSFASTMKTGSITRVPSFRLFWPTKKSTVFSWIWRLRASSSEIAMPPLKRP